MGKVMELAQQAKTMLATMVGLSLVGAVAVALLRELLHVRGLPEIDGQALAYLAGAYWLARG